MSKQEDLDRLYAAVADSGRRVDVVFANVAVVDVARIGDITAERYRWACVYAPVWVYGAQRLGSVRYLARSWRTA
jgi:hypothetical protein